MSDSVHRPHRLRFRNAVTDEVRTVRFGSPEHRALKAQKHPDVWHRDLWTQLHTPPTSKEDQQS